MGLVDVTKRVPTLGREMVCFFLWPKQFVLNAQRSTNPILSTKEVLGWSLAFSFLLAGFYSLIAGHSVSDAWDFALGYDKTQGQIHANSSSPPSPAFVRIGFMIGLGIGIQTPEAKRVGSDGPQPVIFQAGPGWMLVDNVTPSALVTKVASALLHDFGIVSVLCTKRFG